MVDIKERLLALHPGITFGPALDEADCVIVNGQVNGWGRQEPQPTIAELEAVTQQSIDDIKLAAARDLAWERIKGERIRRTTTGGYHVASVDKWFHSDTESKTQQLGLALAGANIPPGLEWKTMNGIFVGMTQALAGEIFAAAMTQESATFTVAENHREQMLLSADPLTYDYSAGWPLIYEDTL